MKLMCLDFHQSQFPGLNFLTAIAIFWGGILSALTLQADAPSEWVGIPGATDDSYQVNRFYDTYYSNQANAIVEGLGYVNAQCTADSLSTEAWAEIKKCKDLPCPYNMVCAGKIVQKELAFSNDVCRQHAVTMMEVADSFGLESDFETGWQGPEYFESSAYAGHAWAEVECGGKKYIIDAFSGIYISLNGQPPPPPEDPPLLPDLQVVREYVISRAAMGDALFGRNCEQLKGLQKRIGGQLRNVRLAQPFEGQADFIKGMEESLAKIQAAIEKDCNKPVAEEAPPNILIGSDSPQWCTFRDGNPESTPIIPLDDDPLFGPGSNGPGSSGPGLNGPGSSSPADGGFFGGGIDDPLDALGPGGSGNDGPPGALDPDILDDSSSDLPALGGDLINDDPVDDDESDDPRDATVKIYVKAKADVLSGAPTGTSIAGQQIKLFAGSTTDVALPGNGVNKPQTDHSQDPIQGVTDANGNLVLTASPAAIGASPALAGGSFAVNIDTTAQTSLVVGLSQSTPSSGPSILLPGAFQQYVTDTIVSNGQTYTVLTLPSSQESIVTALLTESGLTYETNYCRIKELPANDPLYTGNRAWEQSYENQWAIKRVGLGSGRKSGWNMLGKNPQRVTVAVIDTGLDWNHLDMDWENLWRNPNEIPDNGLDDDNNGYVDDVIGWNFYGRNNNPWDHDGHGTIVTGIIAASHDNGVGIAGINPHARIMVLKAINSFGHSRASYIAKAIIYAVNNGARIINMSVGGAEITQVEKEAIDFAHSKGVLIVVASGNSGGDIKGYGIAGLEEVLTVGATDFEDKRAAFSNWGAALDLAAPGIEVLSLRARRTDTMRDIPGVEYVDGANYVGEDRRYYRASGTSFAAPIVTGVASLVMSKNPDLSGADVARILKQSADDADTPGVNQYSGYGIVNAARALSADPDQYITAGITGVSVVQGKDGPVVQVYGTADADRFSKATISVGAGEAPGKWKKLETLKAPIVDGTLDSIDARELKGEKLWIIRLIVIHKDGSRRETRFQLNLG